MEPSIKDDKLYFENLDVLRFFAAIIVVIAHAYEGWLGWYSKPGFMTTNGDNKTFSTFGEHLHIGITNGGFGVDVFFLISGFLITYILLKEKERFSKINIPKFFIRRAFRIWPAYFLVIALAPICVKLVNFAEPSYLPNLLFYNNFHAIATKIWEYPFAHLWSICVEEHFYLIWPFVISFINIKHLGKVFIAFLVISILSRIYFFTYNYDYLHLYLNTISRIDVLIMGSLYALYYNKYGFTLQTPKLVRIGIYLIFIIVYFLYPVYEYNTLFNAAFKKYFYCGIIGFGMMNFLFNPSPLFQIPFKKLFNYLGKISYGIYLFSNVLIPIVVVKFMYVYQTTNMHIYFLLNFVLSIGISALVYELYEKQFLKIKKHFEIVKTRRE